MKVATNVMLTHMYAKAGIKKLGKRWWHVCLNNMDK